MAISPGLRPASGTLATAAAGLIAAALLAALPARWAESLRGVAAAAVRPAQEWCRSWEAGGAEVQRLREENQQLRTLLATRPTATQANDVPLLHARGIAARVLGQQAWAFLGRQKLLDHGQAAGVPLEAWVTALRRPHVVDVGADMQIAAGQVAATPQAVWGRVVEVGPHTSVVRTVCDAGYRDLVRLGGSVSAAAASAGPQGILEGVGEPLARIRRVDVTAPVAVGDAVYTASQGGLLDEPLLCGRVARVERPVGAAFWEIWMEPAVPADEPQRVTILAAEISDRRKTTKQ